MEKVMNEKIIMNYEVVELLHKSSSWGNIVFKVKPQNKEKLYTYCTNMANSGMNPKTLQYLMGHSDISVTLNIYTHTGYDDAKKELSRLKEARDELEKKKFVTQKHAQITHVSLIS